MYYKIHEMHSCHIISHFTNEESGNFSLILLKVIPRILNGN